MAKREKSEKDKIEKLNVIELTPQKQLVRRYKTLEEAAKKNGVTSKELYNVCRTVGKQLYGHLFMAY